jgi:hypothetical protein
MGVPFVLNELLLLAYQVEESIFDSPKNVSSSHPSFVATEHSRAPHKHLSFLAWLHVIEAITYKLSLHVGE